MGTFDFDPGWVSRITRMTLKTSFMQKGSPSNLKKHTAIRTKQNVSVQIDGQFKKFLGALKIAGKAVTSKQNKERRTQGPQGQTRRREDDGFEREEKLRLTDLTIKRMVADPEGPRLIDLFVYRCTPTSLHRSGVGTRHYKSQVRSKLSYCIRVRTARPAQIYQKYPPHFFLPFTHQF